MSQLLDLDLERKSDHILNLLSGQQIIFNKISFSCIHIKKFFHIKSMKEIKIWASSFAGEFVYSCEYIDGLRDGEYNYKGCITNYEKGIKYGTQYKRGMEKNGDQIKDFIRVYTLLEDLLNIYDKEYLSHYNFSIMINGGHGIMLYKKLLEKLIGDYS